MDHVRVRKGSLSDAEAIATVHVASWQDAYRDLLPDEFLRSLSVVSRTEAWVRHLDNPAAAGAVWVAELGGEVVGFCSVGPSRDVDADGLTGEVYALYVDPHLTGQGIGTALLRAGLETLQGSCYQAATLWVLARNVSGCSFYERRGWRPDGAQRTETFGGRGFQIMRYRITQSE